MRKITTIITSAIAAAALCFSFTGCTEEEIANYVVVGGISEPTRVWNEVVETPEVEVTEEEAEEAYTPDVLPMEPTAFVTNKTADTLTSDKDGEVVATLEEGTELTLVGTTGKGYYQTEDGAFISASDVEKVVIAEEETTEEVAQTSSTTTTTTQTPAAQTPATTEQPAEQPATEQTYEEPQQTQVAEQPQQTEQPAQQSGEQDDGTEGLTNEQVAAELAAVEAAAAECTHPSTHVETNITNLETGQQETHTVCDSCGQLLD